MSVSPAAPTAQPAGDDAAFGMLLQSLSGEPSTAPAANTPSLAGIVSLLQMHQQGSANSTMHTAVPNAPTAVAGISGAAGRLINMVQDPQAATAPANDETPSNTAPANDKTTSQDVPSSGDSKKAAADQAALAAPLPQAPAAPAAKSSGNATDADDDAKDKAPDGDPSGNPSGTPADATVSGAAANPPVNAAIIAAVLPAPVAAQAAQTAATPSGMPALQAANTIPASGPQSGPGKANTTGPAAPRAKTSAQTAAADAAQGGPAADAFKPVAPNDPSNRQTADKADNKNVNAAKTGAGNNPQDASAPAAPANVAAGNNPAPAPQPAHPAAVAAMAAPHGTANAAPLHNVATGLQISTQQQDPAASFDKLGLTIATKAVEGARHFDIRLDPPELGRVDVRLTVDDSGKTQASLVVDKPQTLELLQRDSANLNRALSDAGLNLSNNSLNFSLRDQGRQNDGGVDQGRGRALSAKAVVGTDAISIHSSLGSYAPHSARLDIRV